MQNNNTNTTGYSYSWIAIRNILKEKAYPNPISAHYKSSEDYWRRFTTITGKTREDVIENLNELKTK